MQNEITKEELEQWKNQRITIAVFDKLREYRNSYVSALSNGETLFYKSDKTQAETARVVGVIFGIDLILEIDYEGRDD